MKNRKPNNDFSTILKKKRLLKIILFSSISLVSCGIIVTVPTVVIIMSNNANAVTPIVPTPTPPPTPPTPPLPNKPPVLKFITNINNVTLPSDANNTTTLTVAINVENPIPDQELSYQ